MAFAVSTQALAAKVALSGKTLNVRKNAAKAVRNTSVRAAVSAPAVSKYSSSREPPRLAHLARSFARDRPRFRPHARDNSRGRVRALSARPAAASSSRARDAERGGSRELAHRSFFPHPSRERVWVSYPPLDRWRDGARAGEFPARAPALSSQMV